MRVSTSSTYSPKSISGAFVVDAFHLAILTEAATVAIQVVVLHQLLKIFLCLHINIIKSEAKVLTYLNIALRSNGGLLTSAILLSLK